MELQTVKDFLRIDGDAEDTLLQTLILNADDYLYNSIADYNAKSANARFVRQATHLKLLIISDLYNNRSLVTEGTEKLRYATQALLCQLQYGVFSE